MYPGFNSAGNCAWATAARRRPAIISNPRSSSGGRTSLFESGFGAGRSAETVGKRTRTTPLRNACEIQTGPGLQQIPRLSESEEGAIRSFFRLGREAAAGQALAGQVGGDALAAGAAPLALQAGTRACGCVLSLFAFHDCSVKPMKVRPSTGHDVRRIIPRRGQTRSSKRTRCRRAGDVRRDTSGHPVRRALHRPDGPWWRLNVLVVRRLNVRQYDVN